MDGWMDGREEKKERRTIFHKFRHSEHDDHRKDSEENHGVFE